jgi:hypothetical protein
MYQAPSIAYTQRIVGAETTVVGRVSSTSTAQPNINLLGILTHMTASDATTVQVWAGITATATARGAPLTGIITFATGSGLSRFMPVPAYCSGGAVVNVTGQSDVTLYWSPA